MIAEEALQNIGEVVSALQARVAVCSEELSKCDREISDIMHYIEFTHLNASQGYKAYSMLKEHLARRRPIKQEMESINALFSAGFSAKNLESARKGLTTITQHYYTPRILNELFAEGEANKAVQKPKKEKHRH